MKYYEVKVKCGHVGRNNYILKDIYIAAESGKEAARIARIRARVKHHHKYAIRSCRRISKELYLIGLERISNDDYFKCKSKQEQRRLNAVKDNEILRESIKVNYKKSRLGQNMRYKAQLQEFEISKREGFIDYVE